MNEKESLYYEAGKLLERNRVGLLMRVFAHNESATVYQVDSALSALEKALAISVNGKSVFARIDFLVSADQEYYDSDCGKTAELLRTKVAEKYPAVTPISVLEVKKGDIHTVLCNYGIANQTEDRVTYSMLISHSAKDSITDDVVTSLLALMYRKARVAGVAIGENRETIEKGHIMNIFSVWHNKSLISIGGFDLRAAHKKKTDHDVEFVKEGDKKHMLVGASHIIPLIRMVEFFGPCIGVVVPPSDHRWDTFDKDKDKEWYERHVTSSATSSEREKKMAGLIGKTLEDIEKGVMEVVRL